MTTFKALHKKKLKTKEGEIHYWVGGKGSQWIIFTHGATMDHGLYSCQAEYFASQYRIIVWDCPGHGRSRPSSNISLEYAAQQLLNIMDQEGVEKANLVGQSMGGYVAQIAVRNSPQRFSSLVTVGSTPMQPSYFSTSDRFALALVPFLVRLYPRKRLLKLIANSAALHETSRVYALRVLSGFSKREIAAIMKAVYQGIRHHCHPDPLPVPVLVTFGEHDKAGKVEKTCRKWAETEHLPLKVIPMASHNANMDNPEEFNRVLEDFLVGLSGCQSIVSP
jgi:pimeloyl-ACP methyl ester carboxylesterase